MDIQQADVDLVAAAQREVAHQRWRALASIVLFFVSLVLPWLVSMPAETANYCRGIGLGLFIAVLGMRSQTLHALTFLGQRAINSTPEGVALQARSEATAASSK
jgi:hypothetical protein